MIHSRSTNVAPTRRFPLVLLVTSLVVAAGCGDDLRTAPSSLLAGTWTGAMTDNVAGPGTLRLTLSESPGSVTGTWATTFPAGDNGGSLGGSVNGSSLTLVLTPTSDPGSCSVQVFATINGDRITGTYTALDCSGFVSGSIDLTRQ